MRQLVLGGEYETEPYRMISGFTEAAKPEYDIHVGKSGKIWLVGRVTDRGGAIYVQGDGPGSQGFGGATIGFRFNTVDTIMLQGPWHSNPNSLFADTGVDYRNHHITFGVIGTDRKWEENKTIITGLVYFDKEPTLGAYSRIEDLAKRLAAEQGKPLAFYFCIRGGSSCGVATPGEK